MRGIELTPFFRPIYGFGLLCDAAKNLTDLYCACASTVTPEFPGSEKHKSQSRNRSGGTLVHYRSVPVQFAPKPNPSFRPVARDDTQLTGVPRTQVLYSRGTEPWTLHPEYASGIPMSQKVGADRTLDSRGGNPVRTGIGHQSRSECLRPLWGTKFSLTWRWKLP